MAHHGSSWLFAYSLKALIWIFEFSSDRRVCWAVIRRSDGSDSTCCLDFESPFGLCQRWIDRDGSRPNNDGSEAGLNTSHLPQRRGLLRNTLADDIEMPARQEGKAEGWYRSADRGLCTREGDLLWMRACSTWSRNQMLLAMQQICLLRGDKSEQGRSFCFFVQGICLALDHYNLCGVGVGFCCVIFAAEILAVWLENSSMCVSGIRCGSAWLHGSTVLQLKRFEPVVIHYQLGFEK
ncbi:hypothetical protein AB3S75_011174 [Citrus x aurantiifolia]